MYKNIPFHRIICLIAVFFTSNAVFFADTANDVDSLLQCYDNSRGHKKATLAKELLKIYSQSDIYLNDNATRTNNEEELSVLFGADRFYTTNAQYSQALIYSERALPLAMETNGDIHATLLCDRCYCMFKTGDYTQAVTVGQEAIRASQKIGNLMQLSRAYLYLGIINHGLRNYDDAKDFVRKSIETNERLGINEQTHNALGIACEIFCSAGEIDQAIEYGKQAVEAADSIGFQAGVANHLTQLSYAYDRKGDYEQGLAAANKALEIVNAMSTPDRNLMATSLEFKAWNLIDMKRNREAVQALRQAIKLETEIGNTMAVWNNYRTLSEALEPIDMRESLAAMKRYARMGDSIHTVQLTEAVGKANAEFHNEELKEENAKNRRMNRIGLIVAIGISLLLITAIASLWFAFQQKAKTNQTLRRLTKLREEFFTNVTHEFRTPLTVILGLGKELQEKADSIETDTVRQLSQKITEQGETLLRLVNELLDISKIKSAIGKQTWRTDNVTVYVEMLVENHREVARAKQVTIDFETDPSPIITTFVPDYMKKLVNNLLSNAVKFAPEGGVVNVSLHFVNEILNLSVSDNGKGIPAEHLPHVYEPFYQADNTGGIGTGVGLALVKQIVDALNGSIDVESEPGHTTFSVKLGKKKPHIIVPTKETKEKVEYVNSQEEKHIVRPEKTTVSISQEGQADVAHISTGTSILVVEDNMDVALYIGHLLDEHYEVHYAKDGEEGLEMARELIPDLIITDLMMPKTDGLTLCHEIRSNEATNHIPLIVITAKATEEDRLKGLKAGVDAYLYKPFNAEELNIRTNNLLERRQMLREKYHNNESQALEIVQTSEKQEEKSFTTTSMDFIEKVNSTIQKAMKNGQADVEYVANELGISSVQFRRKMTAITGIAPKQYIQEIRLSTARDMLENDSELTVSEVAEKCGFYDISHFTRIFRKKYGVNPGQYQKDGTES